MKDEEERRKQKSGLGDMCSIKRHADLGLPA